MEIKKIEGDMCNVYLIKDVINIVVDAGAKVEEILKITNKVDYIFITHAHFDHIYYLNDYIKSFNNCKVLLSEQAYNKLENNNLNAASIFDADINISVDKERVIFINDGDKINELKIDNHFIKLQGHTDCCLGLVIKNHLFLGDVLFFTGIGRYDLPTGSIKDTMGTQRKLKSLTGVDFIYSGHGVSPFAFKK